MSDKAIIQIIEEFVNSKRLDFDISVLNKLKSNEFNVAFRFIEAWKMLNSEEITAIDFESVLKDYLLFNKTEILINDYELSKPNLFGLAINQFNKKIYAKYSIPSYVKNKFVQDVYNGECVILETEKYAKATNPFIKELTGFKYFKSIEQQLAVTGALKTPCGFTTLIAMLTGGGKSLITQAVSYQYEESLSIIIVPTVSLMLDQVRNAKDIINPSHENEIMCYYSGCDSDIVINEMKNKTLKMLYISPETIIKNKKIQSAIITANKNGYLKNLIIDEAHIIIEWGASFREDFQCIDAFRNILIEENGKLRTFLLSATFSENTVKYLKRFYSKNDNWIEIRLDSLRKEPRYNIIECDSYIEKQNRLRRLVCVLPHPMIIYVNSPSVALQMQNDLVEIGFENTRVFTGETNSNDRQRLIEEWTSNMFNIMIATCAFGVGVDKSDVRTVIHTYIPASPNQYYQECGRGGRDGFACLSVMLYYSNDITQAKGMLQKVITTPKFCGRWFSMINSDKTYKKIEKTYIDTSVKPNYIENDDFYYEVNNANIVWNVYVLLLLRRAGKIDILEALYKDDKYFFTVKINDNRIMFDSEETKSLFEEIRQNEVKIINSDITKLINKIKHSGESCFSTIFNEVFLFTDEYCAGCDYHEKIICDAIDDLPLKKPLDYPVTTTDNKIKILANNSNEMLILSEKNQDIVVKLLIENNINVVVIPDNYKNIEGIVDVINYKKDLMIINFYEFNQLYVKGNKYYLSGAIAFLIDNEVEMANKVVNINTYGDITKILIAKNNFYIESKGKNISEIINGPCKYDYIIEEELK